jgi:hypothetical protein
MNQNNINSTSKYSEYTNLYDPINYNINFRQINESKDIPYLYKLKCREIKEVPSISSFRMNQLKKHQNIQNDIQNNLENNLENKTEFFNGLNKIEVNDLYSYSKNYIEENESDLQTTFKQISNNSEPLSNNVLSILDTHLNNLKRESEYELNNLNSNENEENSDEILLEEKNVATEFLNAKNDVYQVFKHVKTKKKPEYLTLEQVQKEREENEKKIKELEKEYLNNKNKEKIINFEEQKKLNKKFNYKPEVLEELKMILEHENKIFNFEKKINKKNKKYTNKDFTKNQENFIKKFVIY